MGKGGAPPTSRAALIGDPFTRIPRKKLAGCSCPRQRGIHEKSSCSRLARAAVFSHVPAAATSPHRPLLAIQFTSPEKSIATESGDNMPLRPVVRGRCGNGSN
jgi:hypothetical protein